MLNNNIREIEEEESLQKIRIVCYRYQSQKYGDTLSKSKTIKIQEIRKNNRYKKSKIYKVQDKIRGRKQLGRKKFKNKNRQESERTISNRQFKEEALEARNDQLKRSLEVILFQKSVIPKYLVMYVFRRYFLLLDRFIDEWRAPNTKFVMNYSAYDLKQWMGQRDKIRQTKRQTYIIGKLKQKVNQNLTGRRGKYHKRYQDTKCRIEGQDHYREKKRIIQVKHSQG
ncbi:unnamed protein product [Paramecium sonneborni]|uniref:Uncharacterized protein n=1 Tax=Paramecium sonneborni TaxID=65129 RepID=A0A8S1NK88_9CILI|nr:unnamed protein product [Paramecium sonneborni]